MTSIEETLVARREALLEDLDRLTEPPEEGASVGFGKRVGDGTTEALERLATTATARSIASSINEIDRALQKLAEESYGYCDECKRAIAPARLEARPATALCVDCASQ